MRLQFDSQDRAQEKERSREEDAQALASGQISREELRRKNGRFVAPPDVELDLVGVRLY